MDANDSFTNKPVSKISRWISAGICLVICIIPWILFLYVAFRRFKYPFDIGWWEGQALDLAIGFGKASSIYPSPSATTMGLWWFPGIFWLDGLSAMMFGPQLWAGRTVSLFGAIGIAFLLVYIIGKHRHDYILGTACAALFFTAFIPSGAMLDTINPFGPAWCLALASFAFAGSRKIWAVPISLILMLLAGCTHPATLLMVPACAAINGNFKNRMRMILFFTVPILGTAAVAEAYQITTNGLFLNYLLSAQMAAFSNFSKDLTFACSYFSIPLVILGWRITKCLYEKSPFYFDPFILAFIGCTLAFLLPHADLGNDLKPWGIPLAVGCALAFGAFAPLSAPTVAGSQTHIIGPLDPVSARGILAAFLIIQILAGVGRYTKMVPTEANMSAAQNFIVEASDPPGEVWVADHIVHHEGITHYITLHSLETLNRDPWPKNMKKEIIKELFEVNLSKIYSEELLEDSPLQKLIFRQFKGRSSMIPFRLRAKGFFGKENEIKYLYNPRPSTEEQ